ncbi:hypothetical protein GWN42_28285 [candidate division KSB1 bacterium]|nr:hypothetical protein [candidate division KSB1 bacterium]
MKRPRERLLKALVLLVTFTLIGCATVPKEVVELSYTIGGDLEEVHASYKRLVQTHFDGLRAQTLDFFNNKWKPTFLRKFIENSNLVERVSDPDPERVLVTVEIWAETAIDTIEAKKKQLLDPINEDERELMQSIDDAFANLIRANATVTAHLNSIREVKELQDETLSGVGIKNLRDKINNGLMEASHRAKEALEKFKEAEG